MTWLWIAVLVSVIVGPFEAMYAYNRMQNKRRSGMQEEILNSVRKYREVVRTQDKQLYDSLFSDRRHCRLISGGNLYEGKESIYADFLIGGIRQAYSAIELVSEDVEITELGGDTAVVTFRYHTECVRRENGEPYGIRGVETQVLVREEGTWKIMHVHYSIA